ncbi:UNVERIFIED_CONTAM: hypothetical protein K2H54_056256 [Gekko kuhli]
MEEAPANKEPDAPESAALQENAPEPSEPPDTAPAPEYAQQDQAPPADAEQSAIPPEVTAPLGEETAGSPERSRFRPSPRTTIESTGRRSSKFRRSTSGVQSLQETLKEKQGCMLCSSNPDNSLHTGWD